ncbi:hypothetical protein Pint_21831 [Pistacia integerrima]|uniref:Uncharacterized protein n=1 Tax=Pistacia integerrima TaxID=434235 RepID=A0ACC0XCM5_9ROSI|nr:hypothetical protein Pint_21831 [Pistacia integerrima]
MGFRSFSKIGKTIEKVSAFWSNLKRLFGSSGNAVQLDRDFLAQFCVADNKLEKPQGRWFSGSAVPEENPYEQGKPVLRQPPVSQPVTGFLEPGSPEECECSFVPWMNMSCNQLIEFIIITVIPSLHCDSKSFNRNHVPVFAFSVLPLGKWPVVGTKVVDFVIVAKLILIRLMVLVAPLLARSNLLINRDTEWANLVLGFEKENRYAVVDVCYPQSFLRLRRPFSYITDVTCNEVSMVCRPFWWITSSIYAEINVRHVN